MPRYIKGDLFSHSGKGTIVLAHTCNPFGLWGGGIAAQFRKRYPYSNKLYKDHCKYNKDLLGSCFLVPTTEVSDLDDADILIACLFTTVNPLLSGPSGIRTLSSHALYCIHVHNVA